MSDNNLFKNIRLKYLLEQVFSLLHPNKCYNIIKINKYLKKNLNISFKDFFFNYNYHFSTKNEIIQNIKNMQEKYEYISYLSFSAKYCLYYSCNYQKNLNDIDDKNIFLIKYKGYKINDYPLPSNFNSMTIRDKINISNILESNKYFYKYTLNDENIKLIDLINKYREKNGLNKLIYNKIENLNDYLSRINTNNNYNFINPIGEFKNKLIKNDENITKVLSIKNLKCIMIFESEKNEHIFVYQDDNEKIKEKNDIKLGEKMKNFHIKNSTISEFNIEILSNQSKSRLSKILKESFEDEGYQIFSFKNDTLIGVLEGPPDTPFENGYYLFKMIFPLDYPFKPPQFIFISKIFHPNISESGYVSIDILQYNYSPALALFRSFIYSVQSLLDDPNPDNFLNGTAANLYKKDRRAYDETVREYTSLFSNYSKFLEDIKNMNIEINKIKEGERFTI